MIVFLCFKAKMIEEASFTRWNKLTEDSFSQDAFLFEFAYDSTHLSRPKKILVTDVLGIFGSRLGSDRILRRTGEGEGGSW